MSWLGIEPPTSTNFISLKKNPSPRDFTAKRQKTMGLRVVGQSATESSVIACGEGPKTELEKRRASSISRNRTLSQNGYGEHMNFDFEGMTFMQCR